VENDQTATAGFLKAEEVATRLVEELQRLDEESKRYSGAAGTLEQVGEQLRSLADSVHKSGEVTSELVTAMRGVGAPDIIDRLKSVEAAQKKCGELIEEALAALGEAKRLGAEHSEAVSGALDAFGSILSSLRSGVEAAAKESRSANTKLVEAVTAARNSTREAIEGATKEQREALNKVNGQLRVAVIVSAVAAVLAGAAVIVLFLR
jgi:hypothetical protein